MEPFGTSSTASSMKCDRWKSRPRTERSTTACDCTSSIFARRSRRPRDGICGRQAPAEARAPSSSGIPLPSPVRCATVSTRQPAQGAGMLIRFWGTRGSLAKPGPTTLRYGGNTSCVEVRAADGTLIVLDCGTGAHDLGRALLMPGDRPERGHLLISHTQWDHIQGFPFFGPLFVPDTEWDVYAPRGLSRS